MASIVAERLPAITDSVEQAKADIADHGVAILSRALSATKHATLRDANPGLQL